jgi:integrase
MPRKRTGNIQQRSENSFRIRYVDANGLRQSESIQGTRADAERELAIRLGELAAGIPVSSKPNTVTFAELANDVVVDYEVNGYASVADIETRFRLHIIPIFGSRKAAQITTAQLKHYILRRQNEGAATGTINRELEAIRHTFNLAREGRKLLFVPHVPMLREDNVRTGFFTREEVERLCSLLNTIQAAFVMFAFLTGWRVGEIRKLLWSAVDFARNEIRLQVGRTKNREGRVFPMTEELRNLLESIAGTKRMPTGEVAVDVSTVKDFRMATSAHPVFPVGDFRKSWARACYKAGLPCTIHFKRDAAGNLILGTQREAKGKPLIERIEAHRTPHDLRRSFAREMDRQGIRRGAIKKLGGWKTDSVFNRYNIVSEEDLRDAIEKINEAKRTTKRTKRDSGNRGTQ